MSYTEPASILQREVAKGSFSIGLFVRCCTTWIEETKCNPAQVAIYDQTFQI
jgi:hypothetical protein